MLKPKKKFGQHYLCDESILDSIVQAAELQDEDFVWEIGPGTGNLTKHLIKHQINLIVFEIDQDLIPPLITLLGERSIIVPEDILRTDWTKYLNFHQSSSPPPFIDGTDRFMQEKKIKIITNLPFQISSPFLFQVVYYHQYFQTVIVMLQNEVAKRVCAVPGNKEYGVLSLKIQFYFRAEYLFCVSAEKFTPSPQVSSAVIKLIPRTDIPALENYNFFWEIVETAFKQRRKTLKNNFKNGKTFIDKTLQPQADRCPIDLNRRGETLSEKEFIDLYYYYYPTNPSGK